MTTTRNIDQSDTDAQRHAAQTELVDEIRRTLNTTNAASVKVSLIESALAAFDEDWA